MHCGEGGHFLHWSVIMSEVNFILDKFLQSCALLNILANHF